MSTRAMLWAGWGLSGLFALFMLGASVTPKLAQMPIAEETMAQLGWPPGYAFMIGIIELVCVVLYLIPRTGFFPCFLSENRFPLFRKHSRVLGTVLMMGLLGGAMATQIRAESPLFSHFFSV
ncbi:DoxX family protein [Filomicrobium sp.]|uniref:DoxX family protein n=1 Tax=Filomicrobium sp. TaxID=2024831 RepID=UPI00258D646C|nr:DoxX family protein [Filomicrobium sp.]